MDKDRLKAVEYRLRLLEEKTKKLAEEAQQIAGEVAALHDEVAFEMADTEEERDRGDIGRLKRGMRLNDAGIGAVNAAFASGATVTEVARQFGISVSAAHNRRTLWLAEQGSKAARK